jgi:hypothetical protein
MLVSFSSGGCLLVPRIRKHNSGYVVLTNLGSWVGEVCWKPCSSCWSLYLLWEEFLSAPIHSPLSSSSFRSFNPAWRRRWGRGYWSVGSFSANLKTVTQIQHPQPRWRAGHLRPRTDVDPAPPTFTRTTTPWQRLVLLEPSMPYLRSAT